MPLLSTLARRDFLTVGAGTAIGLGDSAARFAVRAAGQRDRERSRSSW